MPSHDLGEVEKESLYEDQAGLELLILTVSQVLAMTGVGHLTLLRHYSVTLSQDPL